MSTTLTYDDLSANGGTKPSIDEVKRALQSAGRLTLTVTKPLQVPQDPPNNEYVLPFKFDVKVFSFEGEFKINRSRQWSGTLRVKVTLIGAVSRELTTHIDYQHAEHCQELSLGDFASVKICGGVRYENLCAYVKGTVSSFGFSADFDEQIACIGKPS
jgi:hypothetical protein